MFLFLAHISYGQERVNWNFQFNKSSQLIEIIAEIDEGWRLYSQYPTSEFGPVPTSFQFVENPSIIFIGKTQEPESIAKFDATFDGEVNYFKEKVVFTQQVDVQSPTDIEGTVTFMVCNATMCLPPTDKKFKIEIN